MQRRYFILGSALAQVAASTQSAHAQSTDKVRTAHIGVGNRGSYLLRTVLDQPNAKVVALCDIKPDRLDKAATAAAKDNPKTFTDWRKVLDLKDVDAVFIATPPYLHSEMAIAALHAGKHVYCEKPIGVTPAQVKALLAAARASKKIFVPGQQMRSYKSLQTAIGKIHDGAIGDLFTVKAQRHAGSDLPHDGSSGDWYFDVAKSGGYLIEQSVHNLDVCNWVLNAHPIKAAGFGAILRYKNDPPGRTIFDCGSITYDYPDGRQLSFTQNVFQARGLPVPSQYVYVYGSKGTADLFGKSQKEDILLYPMERGNSSVLATREADQTSAHQVAFFDAIVNGGKLPADVVIGATAALTAILGHQAMTKGQTVTWHDLGVDV